MREPSNPRRSAVDLFEVVAGVVIFAGVKYHGSGDA
jgi:hypothetical protein